MAIDNEKKIWDFLMAKLGNAYGAAGLMGNLDEESRLNPMNLEDGYEKKLGLNDKTYTEGVDNGTYKKFCSDSCGYGLAQWTYGDRKKALLDYARSVNKSIGDLDMQLEYLFIELEGYKSVIKVLKTTKSVKEASDIVLVKFEKPKDQSDSAKAKRAKSSQKLYDKYATGNQPKAEYNRSTVANIMRSWLGRHESDGSHKPIVDTYNDIKPLPAGYKMKYTDAWCAATVSAAFHAANYDDIFPSECSCNRMIAKAQKMAIFVERDDFVPNIGDCVLYDWEDSGYGDNVGQADHVGMVIGVSATRFTVIEGNYNDSVKERTLDINGKYIRGFVTPKFNVNPKNEEVQPIESLEKQEKVAAYAQYRDNSLAGAYKATTAVNMRLNAGTLNGVIVVVPKDTVCRCYGYYNKDGSTKWLYVTAVVNGKKYVGYIHSDYLAK